MRSLLLVAFVCCACGAPSAVVDAGADAGLFGHDAGLRDAGTFDAGQVDAGVVDAGPGFTLTIHYPAGTHSVSVRGSVPPLNWNSGTPMHQVDPSTWTVEVSSTAPDLEWKPLLDDATWSKGPNYRAHQGAPVDVAPRFFTDTGTWSRQWPNFSSTLLGNTRGVWIYLPPTYAENAVARFPVLYMHDGQNLFDPAAAFGGNTWQVAQTMDQGANDGTIAEAIVVGPENTADRIPEYTPTADAMYGGGNGARYLRMLVEELKPQVDLELRTLPGREHAVLMGSSLGGLISVYAGLTHADTWGAIGAMSPSTWWDNTVILGMVAQSTGSRPLRVYVDSGDSGASNDDVTNTAALAQAWRGLGYVDGVTLKYLVQPGATHTETAWASRLPGALQFLLGPGR
jgi:predicted alpha/beta superfamily hydrolase